MRQIANSHHRDGTGRTYTDGRPSAIEADPADPGDYGSRANNPVDLLVLHTTEGGSVEGATEHWGREDVVASAHYVLDGRRRRIVQCVAEGDAAYACGNRQYNRRSISIEVVGHAARAETWAAETLELLAWLAAQIVRRHGIPVDRHHIIGHVEIPCPGHQGVPCPKTGGAGHHTDPGPHIQWDDLLELLHLELHRDREPGWQDAGAGRAP